MNTAIAHAKNPVTDGRGHATCRRGGTAGLSGRPHAEEALCRSVEPARGIDLTVDGARVARLDAALAAIRQRLEREPDAVDALFEKARLLSLLGEDDAAKDAYVALLHRDATHFGALTNLAALALASGHRSAALTAYRQAAVHHPQNPTALVNLAGQLLDDGHPADAREAYEAALKIDPERAEAHQGLARTLAAMGDDAAAAPHWHKGFAAHSMVSRPYRGRGNPVRILLLVSVRGGNIPTQLLLDDRIFAVSALYAEFHDPSVPLPEHDVVFNAIGDADLCGEGLAAARAISARSRAPLINNPDAALRTGRAENAKRLGGLEDVVAPRVELFSKSALCGSGAQSLLSEAGLEFPLLLRAPGFHTGQHFERVECADDLVAAAGKMPAENVLAIQYLDAAGSDGLARKYRVMIVDGKFYPLHLAASQAWKVHYFTSDMAARPELRREEQGFLSDMPSALGPRAMAALARIRDTLGLDYAGVDFARAPDGRLLLFEANATMTILPPDGNPMWDYRRPAITRTLEAARNLLTARVVRP